MLILISRRAMGSTIPSACSINILYRPQTASSLALLSASATRRRRLKPNGSRNQARQVAKNSSVPSPRMRAVAGTRARRSTTPRAMARMPNIPLIAIVATKTDKAMSDAQELTGSV